MDLKYAEISVADAFESKTFSSFYAAASVVRAAKASPLRPMLLPPEVQMGTRVSAEVIALNEGVDDARLLSPPNRIGDDDRIILCHVFNLACNRGARDEIILLDGCACCLIVLVKVMRRV